MRYAIFMSLYGIRLCQSSACRYHTSFQNFGYRNQEVISNDLLAIAIISMIVNNYDYLGILISH